MDLHQMQVAYDPVADRLKWQLSTRGGEGYAVWLTRRMMARLWPHLQQQAARGGLPPLRPGAVVLPEARQMMAEAARQRPLPTADFATPFKPPTAGAQPLGPEPLLPAAIDLAPGAGGRGLALRVNEASGRHLELRLTDDLATALVRLFEQALVASEWFAVAQAPATAPLPPAAPEPGRALN